MRREAGGEIHVAGGGRLPITLALVLLATLAACSVSPTRSTNDSAPPARKAGGYYLDDGPHANPPLDLDRVPDAQPRAEPIKASTTRPYTVLGRTYIPMNAIQPYRATGLASWYGKRYHGQPTASGEIYDMYAMTAAHTTLPIPSYVRVTSQRNGRFVVVRINDRGPFRSDRIIDLSYTAAYKLDMLEDGSTLVGVDAIVPATQRSASLSGTADVVLQLGVFGERGNAEGFLQSLRTEVSWLSGLSIVDVGRGMYRVQAGPFTNPEDARVTMQRLEQQLGFRPTIVTR